MSDDGKQTAPINVNVKKEEKEKWRKRSGASMSARGRAAIRAWIEYEDEHGIQEDFEDMELIVLKTYRNAVEKNIQTMKAQRDKLDKKIEEMEEDGSDEVLVEVDINLKGKRL